MVRVTGGGAAGSDGIGGRAMGSRRTPGEGRVCDIGGRPPGLDGGGPGRGGIPGRGGTGGCVRTGCDGSGRGPPGVCRGADGGYVGRGGGTTDGRAAGCDGRAAAAPAGAADPAAAPVAGRAAAGMAGRSVLGAAGRGTTRGAGVVGRGGVGVVGRCSSIRSRSVGGTMRPGVTAGFAGGGVSRGVTVAAAIVVSG